MIVKYSDVHRDSSPEATDFLFEYSIAKCNSDVQFPTVVRHQNQSFKKLGIHAIALGTQEQIRRPDALHARQGALIEGESSYGITVCSLSFLFHSPEAMPQPCHCGSSGKLHSEFGINF
jgi:hypothetical protein